MSKPVIGWCADCFKELRSGMKLWTRGQDESAHQTLVCNDCARRRGWTTPMSHSLTCPFRGDQRLGLSA